MNQSSYFDYLGRMQAAEMHRAAMEQQHMASRAWAETQGFAQRQAMEQAQQAQLRAHNFTSGFQEHEAAMQAHREMTMAEREQQLKYQQMANETAARNHQANLQYQAMNNMTNQMPGIVGSLGKEYQSFRGQGQQQVPGVNLVGSDGRRIGGSNFSASLRNKLLG